MGKSLWKLTATPPARPCSAASRSGQCVMAHPRRPRAGRVAAVSAGRALVHINEAQHAEQLAVWLQARAVASGLEVNG